MSVNSNYIACNMIGRLGNQLFQIANAYSQAKTHNRDLIIPRHETTVNGYIPTVFRNLSQYCIVDRVPLDNDPYIIDGTYHYTEYIPHPTRPKVFRGFYQSEKYFIKHSAEIKALFRPDAAFIEKAYKAYPQLNSNNIAAINIRRGDFFNFPNRHPVVNLSYINEAVKKLPAVDYYMVVSDDIQWCRDNITLPNCIFANFTDYEALWLISLCQHFVISNSSFSWWAAYLSTNNNKVVITPDTWGGWEFTDYINM